MKDILDELLGLPSENEVVEFKEAKQQYDKNKLGKYFSALANEANLENKTSAYLVFGVKDNQTIVGTTISERQLNEYKKEIADHTSPHLGFISTNRFVREGKEVVVLEIPAAPKGMPVSWKGFKYGRDGESLGALNDNEYDRIKNQVKQTDWSAQIIKEASIADLSNQAIKEARKRFIQKNKSLADEVKSWSDEVFLNKAKITIKGKITNTAILLLGKPEAEHYINPARATVSWILKDADNIEKDYEHFTCPLLLNVVEIGKKIRNLKYRYINDDSLFPDEVDQYDPYIIREALNNCIAHQDYTLGGKIVVVENENSTLVFSNSGDFIPQSIEAVINADSPEQNYRNAFLTNAMVGLNMIDTIGSGIKRMFKIQSKKFFPLPDYEFGNQKVKVTITGKVLDIDYARKLAQVPSLSLNDIILLDKVAKNKSITVKESRSLKERKLIEGRRPNLHISSKVAKATGEKGEYIKMRGFKDDHYKKMILNYLEEYESASKKDLDKLILDILPNVLDEDQKKNKLRNIIYAMSKRDVSITNTGTNRKPIWKKV
ncbi:RNA-binding domain-containing protein [Psychroflexus aestuariivivens]|uniref:RNA-binding domain-containing protein n=1 Tax=Psychroflexus aestuariivivens TaxID=1795040 RepID=UPI000FD91623|nr:RNA-binding domain-containing protein [Psychroflexus aestuariivivens]